MPASGAVLGVPDSAVCLFLIVLLLVVLVPGVSGGCWF